MDETMVGSKDPDDLAGHYDLAVSSNYPKIVDILRRALKSIIAASCSI